MSFLPAPPMEKEQDELENKREEETLKALKSIAASLKILAKNKL